MLNGISHTVEGAKKMSSEKRKHFKLLERTGDGISFGGVIEKEYYHEMLAISIEEDISIRKLIRRMCIKYLEDRRIAKDRTIQGRFKRRAYQPPAEPDHEVE